MPPSGSAASSSARPEPPVGWGAVLAATLAASSVVLVFLPTVVYFFNSSFVEYTSLEHDAVALPATVALGLVLAAPALFPRMPRGLIAGACRFTVIYVVVAAVFLPSWTPALDGREHFAGSLSRASIQSHLLLGGLAVSNVVVLLRRPDWARGLAQGLFVTALAFVAYVAVSDTKPAGSHTSAALTKDIGRLLTFSGRGDILVVLMDQFQGDVFAELLDEDSGLFQAFEGFSYYPNITSVSPQTLLALPAIYSGYIYRGGSIKKLYVDAYQDSLFVDAQRAGYSTTLYGAWFFGCPAATCVSQPVLLRGRVQPVVASYLGLVDYGLMRISPTSLHPGMFQNGLGLLRRLSPSHYTIDSLRGLASFVAQARVEEGPPTLKFLHLMNTHRPINMNRACGLDPALSQTREHYKNQARCGIDAFLDLLAFLKRSSLYEETLVMLLSDHGAALGAPSRPYALDGAVKLHSGRTGKFVPLFLVKPPESGGPLKISQAPASLIDMRATVCEAAKICDPPPAGRSVLSLAEGVARERQFIDYRVFARDIAARDELTAAEMRRFATRAPVRDLDLVTDAGGRPIVEKAVARGVSVR